MDWSIGLVMKALHQYGMADNTLVYFSSDNGGHVEEVDLQGQRTGGYNGIYRGNQSICK